MERYGYPRRGDLARRPRPLRALADRATSTSAVRGTVLFNWLFARQHGGEFLLRDRGHRHRAQPARADRGHPRRAAVARPRAGTASPCYQSERLRPLRAAPPSCSPPGTPTGATAPPRRSRPRQAAGGPPGYDGYCRDRGLGPGPGTALRFRTPDEGTTVVRRPRSAATSSFENATLEDFVILRVERHADVPARQRRRRRRHGHHPRGPGRGARQRHAQVPAALGEALGLRLPAGVRPPAAAREREAPEALQAPRRRLGAATTATGATCPRPWSTTSPLLGWGPPDGVEIRPLRRDRRAVPPRGRQLLAAPSST